MSEPEATSPHAASTPPEPSTAPSRPTPGSGGGDGSGDGGGGGGGDREAGFPGAPRPGANWRLLLCLAVLAMILAGGYFSGSIPGTLEFDETSGEAWGTGTHRMHYPDGAVREEHRYLRGVLTRSRWYDPEGTLIHETDWRDGRGMALTLRDDGTPEVRMRFEGGKPNGYAVYFDPAGEPVRVVEFEDGEVVRELSAIEAATDPEASAVLAPD